MSLPRRTGHDIAELAARNGAGKDSLAVQSGIVNVYRHSERSTIGVSGVITIGIETGANCATLKRIELIPNQPVFGEWRIDEASDYTSPTLRASFKNIDNTSLTLATTSLRTMTAYTSKAQAVFGTEYFGDTVSRTRTTLLDSNTVDCLRLGANKKFVLRIAVTSETLEINCAIGLTILEEKV